MKKIEKKKIMGLLLSACLITTMLLPSASLAEDELTGTMTLEQSIEYALTHSESLNLFDDNIDLKDEALDEAEDQYRDYTSGDSSYDNLGNLERSKIRNQYFVIAAQAEYNQVVADYEVEEEKISYEATRYFYSLLLAQENLESSVTSYERAGANLKLANIRYELGDATALNVTLAENRLVEAQNTMQTNRENLQLTEMQWKLFLGLAYDQEQQIQGSWENLVLPDVVSMVNPLQFEELVQMDSSVIKAENSYELQTISYEGFLNIYNKVNKDYEKYLYEYEQSAYNLDQALNQAWLSLFDDYFGLLQQDRSFKESVADLSYQETLYKQEELKYSLGETSLNDLLDADQSLYNANLQLNQQKINLLLGSLDWQNQYQ
jgi:outer membrane protein TolC